MSAKQEGLSRARMIFYLAIIGLSLPIMYLGLVRHMRFFEVPSKSMLPVLEPGDYIMTVTESHYVHGDIVVLQDPTEDGSYIVKRIVGLPGDTVEVVPGAVIVNGVPLDEPYLREQVRYTLEPTLVPEGGLFVLGDNRNESEDSSRWSFSESGGWRRCVALDTIIGRVRYRYLPRARASAIPSAGR